MSAPLPAGAPTELRGFGSRVNPRHLLAAQLGERCRQFVGEPLGALKRRQVQCSSGRCGQVARDCGLAVRGMLAIGHWSRSTWPFGTFVDLPWSIRFVYWALAVGGCSVLMHLVIGALLSSTHLADWSRLPRIGLGAMLAAFPGATVIGLLEKMMRHNDEVFDHYFWFWICVALLGLPVASSSSPAGIAGRHTATRSQRCAEEGCPS